METFVFAMPDTPVFLLPATKKGIDIKATL